MNVAFFDTRSFDKPAFEKYGNEMGVSYKFFETKLTDLLVYNGALQGVTYTDKSGKETDFETDAVILAIGHSARDTVEMLYQKGFTITQKAFSVGARIEHKQEMINRFDFTDAELERLNTIMTETAEAGLVSGYTQFRDEEKKTLSHIVAATVDEEFFMIFDKLYQTTAVFDQKHLNTNTYLHAWKVYSYNPFANSVFFSDKVQAAG